MNSCWVEVLGQNISVDPYQVTTQAAQLGQNTSVDLSQVMAQLRFSAILIFVFAESVIC